MAHRLYKNDDLPDLKTVNVHRYVKYKSWIRGFFFFLSQASMVCTTPANSPPLPGAAGTRHRFFFCREEADEIHQFYE